MALRDALTERDELVGDEIVEVIEEALVARNHKRNRLIVLPDLEADPSN
jgi:hypothetical protein